MKVGVDGVLVGCWADGEGAKRILDVGTGCGLIALIMAQRYPKARIFGVDVDEASVEEARGNAAASPWSDRVEIDRRSFPDGFHIDSEEGAEYDLIVSNPPYFDSGVVNAATPREIARHQGALSPSTLIRHSRQMLRDGGRLAMVVPLEEEARLEAEAESQGYQLLRKCRVRGHDKAPWKRVLLEWQKGKEPGREVEAEFLTLEEEPGRPTEEYRRLCRDFYLKF